MRGLAALLPSLPLGRLNVRSALDILIIAVLIYYLLKLLRGTRGLQMLVALLLLFLLDEGARWARLGMVEWLLTTLLPYFAIALIVLFQPEIRRALARFGRQFSFGQLLGQRAGASYDDLVLAAGHFSQNRIGALVVIERDVSLSTYIESGIALDANLSYDLLIAIFRPGSPMHDGAVILQRDRICIRGMLSAALAQPGALQSTRHAPSRRHRHHRGKRRDRRGGLGRDRRDFHRHGRRDRAGHHRRSAAGTFDFADGSPSPDTGGNRHAGRGAAEINHGLAA
jgi:diadenylate cyclase